MGDVKQHFSPDAKRSAISFSQRTWFAIRPKPVLSQSGGGRKVSPSISSGSNFRPQLLVRTPHSLGEAGCLLKRSAGFRRHRMTQAHLHTALHSCAYVQSWRNIQYSLMASLRATATLASARCLRMASRR